MSRPSYLGVGKLILRGHSYYDRLDILKEQTIIKNITTQRRGIITEYDCFGFLLCHKGRSFTKIPMQRKKVGWTLGEFSTTRKIPKFKGKPTLKQIKAEKLFKSREKKQKHIKKMREISMGLRRRTVSLKKENSFANSDDDDIKNEDPETI